VRVRVRVRANISLPNCMRIYMDTDRKIPVIISLEFVMDSLHEKPKCFSNKKYNQFKPEKQIAINNAIEIRRLHL
jgi:hypothetical protein